MNDRRVLDSLFILRGKCWTQQQISADLAINNPSAKQRHQAVAYAYGWCATELTAAMALVEQSLSLDPEPEYGNVFERDAKHYSLAEEE